MAKNSNGKVTRPLPPFTIREINDKPSAAVPSLAEMLESQRQGSTGNGLPENDHGPLNSSQGHGVDIRE